MKSEGSLVHALDHAQADFGEALAIIGGVEHKIYYFAFDLPHSDANFVVAYLADVIDRLAKGWPRSRLPDLMPWSWAKTRAAEAAAAAVSSATAAADVKDAA